MGRPFLVLVLVSCFEVLVDAQRLPDTFVPENYKLDILINLGDKDGKFDFVGNVRIKAKCLEDTDKIVLHSKDLEIKEAKVQALKEKSNLGVAKMSTDENDNDFVSLELDKALSKGEDYEIQLGFKGKLEDKLSGLYRSTYTDKKSGQKRYIATTQFEATDARRAFPCFDEPAMKATFDIRLGHNKKYTALSNMPVKEQKPIEGMDEFVWTTFEKTVPMSTYLVALIVSDLEHVSEKHGNVSYGVWARKDAIAQTKFAQEVGPKFLQYYEKFYDIRYPLPKVDMVALPDFAAGAMENWGLITYRETALLYDPALSSKLNQFSVASVIAHELAHQWFGNLVTMKWWTDLWLNEGFATYMAGLAVHNQFPEWNSLDAEVADNLLGVFDFDSLKSSHPISVKVNHSREIDEIFDTISYKKGSFVLRMMSLFLGEDTLRKGVSEYLKRHEYNNAEQDDLWEKLTEQAHEDASLPKELSVKKIMDTWTLQTGYPVVTVRRNYGEGSFDMRQKRFLEDTRAESTEDGQQCWWIPVSYTDAKSLDFSSTRPKLWMECNNDVQKVDSNLTDDAWLLLNIEASALARINYDERNWKMLVATLNSEDFVRVPVLNRVQLIDDAAHLSWTGRLDYGVFFDVVGYLERDLDYLPWKTALRSIYNINRLLKTSHAYGNFKRYMRKIVKPLYRHVGGFNVTQDQGTGLDKVRHQTLAVSWACKYNVGDCIKESIRRFEEHTKNPDDQNIIPKHLRATIYCAALKYGGENEWDFLWKRYLSSNVAVEKNTILNILGCTRQMWLLKRLLDWTIDPKSEIRTQDYAAVFSSTAGSDLGYYIAKQFLLENIGAISKSLGPNSRRLGRYVSALAPRMTTEFELKAFKEFLDANKEYLSTSKQAVEQSLETIKLNIQWHKDHFKKVQAILEAH